MISECALICMSFCWGVNILIGSLATPKAQPYVEKTCNHTLALHCAGQAKGVPDETFVAIETLLPTGKGKFLELWAARNVQRAGWTHIVEASMKQKQ